MISARMYRSMSEDPDHHPQVGDEGVSDGSLLLVRLSTKESSQAYPIQIDQQQQGTFNFCALISIQLEYWENDI